MLRSVLRMLRWSPVLVAALLLALPTAASAAGAADSGTARGVSAKADAAATLSPLVLTPIAEPDPVRGSDGMVHLAYELLIVNQSNAAVTLDAVTMETRSGRELGTLDGGALAGVLRLTGGAEGTTFAPSASGYLFADVTVAPGRAVPRVLVHRVSMTMQAPGDQARTIDITGVPVRVSRERAVVVAPPLRGAGWVVANGCCAPPTAHRSAVLSIDGTLHVAERFAIDFVQLGPNTALRQGPPGETASFGYFGAAIRSVAPGTVVNTQDGLPEQTPGALPEGQTVQTAGGNFVVVDIGHGRFAFYAHLQPGSLRVEVGDHIRTGEVLGTVGNTGNSDAPHLHFHVMDGPSPLRSNGLPFVFTRFTGQGVVTDEAAMLAGEPAPVDAGALAGVHRRELPLDLEVVQLGR